MTTTSPGYDKPLPVLEELNAPFWQAAKRGELAMQRCDDCGHVRYPIAHVCPKCLSERYRWKTLSGRGTVYSSIVFHQVYNQAFAQDVPYNVSLIQLEEGPRMISNVVGIAPADVEVGDEVEAVFDAVTSEVSIPRFRRRAR